MTRLRIGFIPLTDAAPLLIAVRGNIDGRAPDLPDSVTIAVGDRIKILLVHIAVYGTKLRKDVASLARREDATLVVCGHSHVPFATEDHGVTVFNPGSIGQPRDRDPKAAYMTFDSERRVVRWYRVDYPVERAQQRILKAGLPKVLADRLALGV